MGSPYRVRVFSGLLSFLRGLVAEVRDFGMANQNLPLWSAHVY